MTTLTSTQLKSKLGEYMERAQREPVAIEKSGRKYAVIISQEEYERFQALEDRFWSEKAREGQASGYLTEAETQAFLQNALGE